MGKKSLDDQLAEIEKRVERGEVSEEQARALEVRAVRDAPPPPPPDN